ncbi:MAG: T9SS type A sorting domain-containing protein [Bacteroidetes bacterium]|nr:T9SS type A sorting domain-containing protein [Bacteroidota bacterium]
MQNFLYQYDLLSSNPSTSRISLTSNSNYLIGYGFLKRGPDDKIYFSTAYQCDAFPYCYPYPDSVYNQINMNLSVINSPDSLGLACNYTPYSFYLGGKRTYYGLPNNPDYDLPALAGSPCDTLVSINEPTSIGTNANLHVYYAPDWEKAFINADNLKGKNYRLRMVDVLGKEVYSESGVLNSQYFTKNLNCTSSAKGMYVVVFETEKEKLTKKFVIE